LYASLINLQSPSEESDLLSIRALVSNALASINTTGKVVDNKDPDTDPEDQLFVPKGRAQTLPLIQSESRKR
jgi:hypothetical protein